MRFAGYKLISDCSKRRPQGLDGLLQVRRLELCIRNWRWWFKTPLSQRFRPSTREWRRSQCLWKCESSAQKQKSLVVEDSIEEQGQFRVTDGFNAHLHYDIPISRRFFMLGIVSSRLSSDGVYLIRLHCRSQPLRQSIIDHLRCVGWTLGRRRWRGWVLWAWSTRVSIQADLVELVGSAPWLKSKDEDCQNRRWCSYLYLCTDWTNGPEIYRWMLGPGWGSCFFAYGTTIGRGNPATNGFKINMYLDICAYI